MASRNFKRRTGVARRLRAALLASSALCIAPYLAALPALAQNATWLTNPGSGDFLLGSNWSTGSVPTGTASFGTSNITTLTLGNSGSFDGWTFDAGASNYTFNLAAAQTFTGAGITINGGSATIINDSNLGFSNTSTAGSASITNNGLLYFSSASTAGSATITNNSFLEFFGISTAGSATITNDSYLYFYNSSTAGNATITNNNILAFYQTSTAGNATLVNNANGVVDFSGSTGPNNDGRLSAGSIAGAGQYILGARELTVGSNNSSTTVSGVISGAGGSLVKTGTGTLTLTGVNTYSGGTTISAGTLVGNTTSLQGDITNNAALTFSQASAGTYAGIISGTGALTKSDVGTLTLSGANTYTGGTTVSAGTLQIGNAGVTGSIVGAVTVGSGGALDIVNATTSGITTISNDGTMAFRNATSAGDAAITNNSLLRFFNTSTAGSATFNNTGILLQFNDSSTAGSATFNNAGALLFNDTSTAGDAIITNNDLVQFIHASTAGSATITNNSLLRFFSTSTAGDAALINNASGTVDFSNSTGPNGDGKLSAGSIAGAGSYVLGANELTVGSNNLSTEVSGAIFGSGSLVKTGTGTLILSGANTYTGATVVDGGTLSVNGSIAASSGVTVNSSGTLGGTGFVPTTVISSGATLAPGNSIGTLTVNGNLTFNTGTTYSVEVSPTAADRTNVTGTATLTGATVQAVALSGSFRGQTYTILTATGGLGGTQFAGLTLTGSSIAPGARNPHLTYDLNNVYLVLDPGTIQIPAGIGGNQAGVAGGINNAVLGGATPPAGFDALLNMTGAPLDTALGQVSGQPGASVTQSGSAAPGQFVNAVFGNAFGGGGTGGNGALGFAEAEDNAQENAYAPKRKLSRQAREAYAAVTPRDRMSTFEGRWGVFASVYGGNNRVGGDATAGTNTTTSRTYGAVVGADYRFTRDTQAGFALGGAGSSFDVAGGFGSGKADIFNAAIYGKHNIGAAYVAGALSYSWQDTTTDRTVTISGTDQLHASFKAQALAARLEGGWRYATSVVGITPYTAVQMTTFFVPSYGETATSGSGTFALNYAAKTSTATRGELGAKFDKAILVRNGVFTLKAKTAWAHDWNTDRSATATFQTLPGSTFTTNGALPSANAALVSLGGEMDWHNGWSIAALLDSEFSRTTTGYTGKGTVRYAW